MKICKSSILSLVLFSCFLVPHASLAKPRCDAVIPDDFHPINALTGDAEWNLSGCTLQNIVKFWTDLHMGSGNHGWDAEFGAKDACNADFPLGRTLSALYQLSRLQVPNNPQGEWYDYAKGWIPKLWGRCESSNGPHIVGEAMTGLQENRVQIYLDGFYGTNFVIDRAALIGHEARHFEGKEHVDCINKVVKPQKSCDTIYDQYGAWAATVNVLWDFSRDPKISPAFRALAGARANQLLESTWFNYKSAFVIQPGDYCPPGMHANGKTNYECQLCPNRSWPTDDQIFCAAQCYPGEIMDINNVPNCIPCKPYQVTVRNACVDCNALRNEVPDVGQEYCIACDKDEVPSMDGSHCVDCPLDSIKLFPLVKPPYCQSCGPKRVPNAARNICLTCPNGTVPNLTGTCCVNPILKNSTLCSAANRISPIPADPVSLYLRLRIMPNEGGLLEIVNPFLIQQIGVDSFNQDQAIRQDQGIILPAIYLGGFLPGDQFVTVTDNPNGPNGVVDPQDTFAVESELLDEAAVANLLERMCQEYLPHLTGFSGTEEVMPVLINEGGTLNRQPGQKMEQILLESALQNVALNSAGSYNDLVLGCNYNHTGVETLPGRNLNELQLNFEDAFGLGSVYWNLKSNQIYVAPMNGY